MTTTKDALAAIGVDFGDEEMVDVSKGVNNCSQEQAINKDPYSKLKQLQRQLEFLTIQEEYVKDEQKNLKRELIRAKEEVKRIQSVPLVIGQFLEIVDQDSGIVSSTTGSTYYVSPTTQHFPFHHPTTPLPPFLLLTRALF